jgi:putative flavoprotein involved in K+ transport
MPVFDGDGYPIHYRGIVPKVRGLYFLGIPFQYALTSSLTGGVGLDAEYIVRRIADESFAA